MEQKYGSKALNSDGSLSSDSEDESDEPVEVSEEVEKQFLKTLALLKTKDPRIYDPSYKFFDEKVEKEKGNECKDMKNNQHMLYVEARHKKIPISNGNFFVIIVIKFSKILYELYFNLIYIAVLH